VAAREGLGIVSLIPNFLLAFLIRPHFVRIDPTPLTAAVAAVSITLLLVLANGLLLEAQRTLAAVLAGESSRPYVQSLRARRLPVGLAMLRNAAGVLLSTWASHLPRLVTALFILEWAFNVHGLGYEGLSAFHVDGRRDKPVILAVTLLSVLLVRLLVVALRGATAWLQPTSVKRGRGA
jgi:ABC-type dipeptide/oligopeptide/nickel transport system permease component